MNYTTLTLADKEYKLVLTTRALCELERKIGKNPIDLILGMTNNKMPTVTECLTVFHSALSRYHHGIKFEDCYDIYDIFIDEGNSYIDFNKVITDILKVSGVLKDKSEGDEENPN